jgi:rhodanese-related sulfurtransferase
MLNLFRRPAHKEITPHALAEMLAAGEAILVDVRESDEFASGHVAGALSMPLSRFQASALPVPRVAVRRWRSTRRRRGGPTSTPILLAAWAPGARPACRS